MQLSKETDYALRALFTLVDHYPGTPVSIPELARQNDIPKRFLEQIMLELKKSGWVHSLPGRYGGYLLARKPSQITMGEIIRHFDGHLAPIPCVSVTAYQRCTQEHRCRFRRVMLEARNLVARLMDTSTLADVAYNFSILSSEREGLHGEGI